MSATTDTEFRSNHTALSYPERQLWFIDQLQPGSVSFHNPIALRLRGRHEPSVIAGALEILVSRHPGLRSRYPSQDGSPTRVTDPPGPVPIEQIDLAGRNTELEPLMVAAASRPFDLAKGPLIRVSQFRLDDETCIVLLELHHIIADGRSTQILVQELGALCDALAAGKNPDLPALAYRYADYVATQEERFSPAMITRGLAFWRKQIGDAPLMLELPTDRPRGSQPSVAAGYIDLPLAASLAAGLKALRRQSGATLFGVFASAISLALAHYTGQRRLLLGVPLMNRMPRGAETVVGHFINVMPLRFDIDANQTVSQLLRQTQGRVFASLPFQDVPFEQLVKAEQPTRDPRIHPIFQSVVNHIDLAAWSRSGQEVEVETLIPLTLAPRYDLTHTIYEMRDGTVQIRIEYDAELFDASSVDRLAGHIERLLGLFAANPEARLGDLDLLPENEAQQLIAQWSRSATPPPPERCVHTLVADQARRAPERIAVAAGGETLSYGALDGRANQLAHTLQELGTGPDQVVGLLMERSISCIIALLGILKAGGAYLALDPAAPVERRALMLRDANVRIVIADPALNDRPWPDGVQHVLAVTDEIAAAAQEPPIALSPDNLVYVSFTSGSTGRPKGVMTSHRGVVRLIAPASYAALDGTTVMLHLSPLAFDASTFEIWGCLAHGGRLVLAPPGPIDIAALGRVIQAEQVNTLWLTAGLFHAAIDQLGDIWGSVRQLLAGGDVLSPASVQLALTRLPPGASLINGYGPTEATTFTCCHTMTAGDRIGDTVPIGRPIGGTRVYVFDRIGGLAPIGVPGELLIGGSGLARGYLNQPGLTAAQFLPNPFVPGERLYRTGDLVRWRPDGTLEFLGRIDTQIKLRGFRIELGEIEAALRAITGIGEVAVIVHQDETGDKQIFAYFVAEAPVPRSEFLRQTLRATLPDYMIPSAFLALDRLPLTPNGKLDRRALPLPGREERGADAYRPPGTPLEELVAAQFAKVLGVGRVGLDDNFFALGGHSLLATKLISYLRRDLAAEIPVRTLFDHPTVGALAAVLAVLPRLDDAAEAIRKATRPAELPLSFAQRRLWIVDQLEPGPTYNIRLNYRLTGRLDRVALAAALAGIVGRHEVLRTLYPASNGVPRQMIGDGAAFALVVRDRREEELAGDLLRLAEYRFDLSAELPIRAELLALSDNVAILALTIHHIAFDAWSIGLFLRELSALYAPRSAALPPPAIQYADFALWQHDRIDRHHAVAGEQAYWQAALADAPALLALPTDRPRPPQRRGSGAIVEIGLGGELRALLDMLGRRCDATLPMILHAGFALTLARWSGSDDIVVGIPVASRDRPETENLIGFLVNTLALRLRIDPAATVETLLQDARAAALGAYSHQELPFERVVELVAPERVPGATPLVQVMLVVIAADDDALALPGIRVEATTSPTTTAKFDLTLLATDRGSAGIALLFEYDTALFDRATIERFAGHFETLLRGMAAEPTRRLSRVSMLSTSERESQITTWSRRRHYPTEMCLHEIFSIQYRYAPNAVAVSCEDKHITYGELEERANRLAHCLVGLGVRPDRLVGLCLERSIELIVGLLGILKAGGGYLPLDPSYPAERLAYMLQDAAPVAVVTVDDLATKLPFTGPMVRLDSDAAAIAACPAVAPAVAVTPDNLAYVIYTSGSTGTPKGAMIGHRQVARLFAATEKQFDFSPRDVWTLFHAFAFDFSVWEIWGALLYGGRLVVVPYWLARTPDAFHSLLEQEGVTILNQTPSAFNELIRVDEERGSPGLHRLRHVVFGGEALALPSLKPWFAGRGDTQPQLINMYGITETTVHVTYRPITVADQGLSSPIGLPIGDLEAHVLDAEMEPVPIGIAGELYVGGAGLARGYLNRAALTAERFVPNPFSAGERLYRSGDLVRRGTNGELDYLGRIDQQVKIRGFRIELGEIESALLACPNVREAAVILRDDGADLGKQLIAYVTATDSSQEIGALRDTLRNTLPDHMVPAAVIVLPRLPLTGNGKLDRRALPAPSRQRADRHYQPPEGAAEALLTGIFADILGLDRVGATDNFFELGGDSIRAVRARSAVLKAGYDVSLLHLFQARDVRGLAGQLALRQEQSSVKAAPFSLIDAPEQADIDRIRYEDVYPLSRLQEGMLFHSLWTPGTATYHDVLSYGMALRLDPAVAITCLTTLVEHHPVLRTSFDLAAPERPLQRVNRAATPAIVFEDWRHLPRAEQGRRLEEWVSQEAREDFDLAAPPVRFILHHLDSALFRLTLSFHHAILDGWSVAALFNEFGRHYEAALNGRPAPKLPVPTSRYADFIRQEMQSLAEPAARTHWRTVLDSIDAASAADAQIARPGTIEAARSEMRSTEFGTARVDRLVSLARTLQVPVKSVLFAAHLHLLRVLSDRDEVVSGLVTNARLEEESSDQVLGLFLNTVPVKASLAGTNWRSLIQQAFQLERDTLTFRAFPLAEIQRLAGNRPLFEVMFNYVNFHVLDDQAQGIRWADFVGFEQTNFPLGVNVSLDPAAMVGRLIVNFHHGRIDAALVESIQRSYLRILDLMTADPDASCDRAQILSAAEIAAEVVDRNATARDIPPTNIPALITAQALRTPQACAVRYEDDWLDYAGLERQANGLAHHLIAEGILPGAIVALCAERSIEMVVALVAILKAGAAYLPLDPGLPRERLATMLANAAPALILVQPDLAHLLPAIAAKRLILPVDPRRIDALPETPPALPLFADSAAYLIYTSGSTGTPKGVLNSHRGLLNRLLWMQAAYPLDAHDRVLQKTAYSFDVSVWEFFWPLIVGAELVMARPEGHKDPSYLIEVIKNAGITTLHFVPSMLAAFLATPGVDTCSSLKRVICSGEALGGGLRDTFHTLLGAELHNLYGPTEAAIDVTAWSCHKSDVGEVPIGRPIWNTQVHILDRAARPVPLGVAGEIYLGGTGLALGYYGRPDLTAERFVPNPFVPGERLYRTGDLGRRRPDGAVDYLGRMDQQVKIRGLRIELGEIEAALCACPGVAQAAVVVREAAAQTKQLVAFVVPADQPPDTAALRDRLRTTLPDYMVPAWITVIGALPLSPSGKLDRRALLQASVPDLEEGTRAPSTPTEMALARLFGDVLNVDKIDAERSFFEMGGDSLLALRLSQRIERGFGRKLAPRDLYSHPSVAALAALLQGDRPSTDHFAIPLRHGRRSRRVIGFLPTVLGLGLHFAELSRQLTVDATILTCRLPGTEPGEQPLASLSEIAAHCLRSFDAESRHDEMTLIGWSFGGIVAHEVACQLARAGRMVRGVILIDAYLQPVVARHETPSEASLHGEFETLIAGHGLVSYARSERGMDGPLAALYDVYKKNVIALREHDGDTLSVPVVEIRAEKTRLNREGAWSGLREVPATNRRTIELPADHYSIVAAANLTPLAALIDGIIGTDSPP